MSISEKKNWIHSVTEKLGIHRDIDAKNIHEFAQLVNRFKPANINIAIAELPITIMGKPVLDHDIADYLQYSSIFTFPIDKTGKSLAKYIENYEQSRIEIPSNYSTMNNMTIRAVITAANRSSQLCADISPFNTNINFRFNTLDRGMVKHSKEDIEAIKIIALKNKLTPFII